MSQASQTLTRDQGSPSDAAKQQDKRNNPAPSNIGGAPNNPSSNAGGAPAGAIENAVDKAKEMASNAGEFVGHAKDKVQEWAHTAKDKVKDAASATGEMAVHAKDKVQELATNAIHGAGEAMHTAKDELTQAIRRYPLQSVLVGVAVGFLLVKATSRS